MELTPCLGLGDILLLKIVCVSNNLDIKTIHLSKQLIDNYRKYPERFTQFITRFIRCLFPNIKVDVVDVPFQRFDFRIRKGKPYPHFQDVDYP
jgi:hypothetical protein